MRKSCLLKEGFLSNLTLFNLLLFFLLNWNPVSGQQPDPAADSGLIRVASCQFPISADIQENARWIMEQIKEASGLGADIVHFPECALSGYPGVDLKTLESFNWLDLRNHTNTILALAQQLEIWVVLGSIHPLGEGFKPMNSLYVINPSGEIIDRYDKRFCTSGDLDFFSAGDHFVVFDINGIKCGLLICFDVRFPELYREYRKLEADIIFQSFYNARQKPGGIHPKIMPVTARTRAATNHFYMSLTNSSAASSWPCYFITPDGLVQQKLEPDKPGILISTVDLSESFYDASRHFRQDAMDGKLSSADPPDHERCFQRKGL